ncbi:MAG: hypothetical protein RXP99_01760, partial [Vulcanisaeta sp.]
MNSFKMTHTLAILLTFTVIVLALPIYAMMRAITPTPTTPIQCPSPESASAKLMRGVTEIAINTEQAKTGTAYYLYSIDESYLGYPLKVKIRVNSTNTNSTYITNCFNVTRLDVNYLCGAVHSSLDSLGLTGSFTCNSSAIVIINNKSLNEVMVDPAS